MADAKLIPVFMPALVALLLRAEQSKGSPLTEHEVLAIRDNGGCVMLPVDQAIVLDQTRGYDDLDPERVWEQWQEARKQLTSRDHDATESF